ncbi:FAD:protein FMN transferase [Pseudoprimorskyibacter insulae]|uniref:FAD:protein FMN transferase n=1 Tax=Pseudoprimorskyibacter insulae TaxID=1695997 RepID=A0A2R8AWL5_9RHOB|nr:FAD:protein FMN transferase [Pseudoprimorskyibacter insulae]SPF80254.1 FAD:protein FMN transferase [Pseudoprimorskyibacter insulae]
MSKMCSDLIRHDLSGATMGTRWHAQLWTDADAAPGLTQAMQNAVDRVDAQMSLWKPDSDLNRLNAAPVGAWTELPAEIMTVLDRALQIGRASGGAFDISVEPAVRAWGFGPGTADMDRARDLLSETRHRPAHEVLELDRGRGAARKAAPARFDLGGIAKGYGTDCLIAAAMAQGTTALTAGIDGDLRSIGLRPDGTAWPVAIEAPDYDRRAAHSLIELTDMAVATSGDYRHWVQLGDKRLSHTINPRLGSPLTTSPASVTVLAEECMSADAWATALMVLGAEDGNTVARALGIKAMFLERPGGETQPAA